MFLSVFNAVGFRKNLRGGDELRPHDADIRRLFLNCRRQVVIAKSETIHQSGVHFTLRRRRILSPFIIRMTVQAADGTHRRTGIIDSLTFLLNRCHRLPHSVLLFLPRFHAVQCPAAFQNFQQRNGAIARKGIPADFILCNHAGQLLAVFPISIRVRTFPEEGALCVNYQRLQILCPEHIAETASRAVIFRRAFRICAKETCQRHSPHTGLADSQHRTTVRILIPQCMNDFTGMGFRQFRASFKCNARLVQMDYRIRRHCFSRNHDSGESQAS